MMTLFIAACIVLVIVTTLFFLLAHRYVLLYDDTLALFKEKEEAERLCNEMASSAPTRRLQAAAEWNALKQERSGMATSSRVSDPTTR